MRWSEAIHHIEKSGYRFFCVSCHKDRYIKQPAKIGTIAYYLHILLTTSFLMVLTFPWFGWKGIVWGMPVAIAYETYYRLRLRTLLACPECKFDPIYYLINSKRAAQIVAETWKKKYEERGLPIPERGKAYYPALKASLKPGVVHTGRTKESDQIDTVSSPSEIRTAAKAQSNETA